MSDDKISDALRMMAYSFYAIGSRNGDEVNIMVGNWLIQASFEPRQMAFALSKEAHSHRLITEGKIFSVNIFDKSGADTIIGFTKSIEKDPDKVKNAHFTAGPETGCPIIDEAVAYLECKVVGRLDSGGDHEVIVGEVIGAGVRKAGKPADTLTLTDIGWSYAG